VSALLVRAREGHGSAAGWRPATLLVMAAAWALGTSLAAGGVAPAADDRAGLPYFWSFYQDDVACLEHTGEATQRVLWKDRVWSVTAPLAVDSPRAETRRVGTPLILRPLETFVAELHARGATDAPADAQPNPDAAPRLRLVLVVHEQNALGPGTYQLQSIIAVRWCGVANGMPGTVRRVGPRQGVTITDWWDRQKSERWKESYRQAFTLAVGEALEWAQAQAGPPGNSPTAD
jgi:hypothetical protein